LFDDTCVTTFRLYDMYRIPNAVVVLPWLNCGLFSNYLYCYYRKTMTLAVVRIHISPQLNMHSTEEGLTEIAGLDIDGRLLDLEIDRVELIDSTRLKIDRLVRST